MKGLLGLGFFSSSHIDSHNCYLKGNSQLEKQPWHWDYFPVFRVCQLRGVFFFTSALKGLTWYKVHGGVP